MNRTNVLIAALIISLIIVGGHSLTLTLQPTKIQTVTSTTTSTFSSVSLTTLTKGVTVTQGGNYTNYTNPANSIPTKMYWSMNYTWQTTSDNFTIPGIPFNIPNGTFFKITNVTQIFDGKSVFGSCFTTLKILGYTTNNRHSIFFMAPEVFIFYESPCDSNSVFSHNLHHSAKVVKP